MGRSAACKHGASGFKAGSKQGPSFSILCSSLGLCEINAICYWPSSLFLLPPPPSGGFWQWRIAGVQSQALRLFLSLTHPLHPLFLSKCHGWSRIPVAGSKPAGSIWPGSAPFLPDLEDLEQAEPLLCSLQGLMMGFFCYPGEKLFSVMSPPSWNLVNFPISENCRCFSSLIETFANSSLRGRLPPLVWKFKR